MSFAVYIITPTARRVTASPCIHYVYSRCMALMICSGDLRCGPCRLSQSNAIQCCDDFAFYSSALRFVFDDQPLSTSPACRWSLRGQSWPARRCWLIWFDLASVPSDCFSVTRQMTRNKLPQFRTCMQYRCLSGSLRLYAVALDTSSFFYVYRTLTKPVTCSVSLSSAISSFYTV